MAVNLPVNRYLTRNVNGLNTASSYTIMGWFYCSWQDNEWHNCFFLGTTSSVHDNCECDPATYKLILSVDFGAVVSGSVLANNTWYHVAVVRSSNTNLTAYLNGVSDCTDTTDIGSRSNNAWAQIGSWADAGDWLNGRVQDVKIWSVALTVDEIKQEMKQGAPARWANLVHWSPMRDQTVSRAEEDRSGRDGSWTESGSGTVTIADGAQVPYRFGTPRAYVPPATGAQTISGVGAIATAEAFGTPQLNLALTLTGITSAESFGSPTMVLYVDGAGGIATAEAFGTPALHFTIGLTGITSAEAFGSPTFTLYVDGAGGIATAEAFGTPDVAPTTSVELAGIATAEAFGSPTLHFTIGLVGIASAEAFGVPVFTLYVDAAGGIATAEAFGTPDVAPTTSVELAGIATAEAFGSPSLHFTLGLAGIASAEAFGVPVFTLYVDAVGAIASAEAFGTPDIAAATVVGLTGIGTEEAFGAPALGFTLLLTGIATAEAFGTTIIVGGVQVVASTLNTFSLRGEVPSFPLAAHSGPALLRGERIVPIEVGE